MHALYPERLSRCVRLACQPTSQQYCSLILNQHQPPVSQQYCSLLTNQHQLSATTKRTQQMETPAHLFCLGTMQKTEKNKDSRRLNLDCRRAPSWCSSAVQIQPAGILILSKAMDLQKNTNLWMSQHSLFSNWSILKSIASWSLSAVLSQVRSSIDASYGWSPAPLLVLLGINTSWSHHKQIVWV